MDIAISHEQGRVPVTIFRVSGQVDMTTYEQLQQQARAAFDAGTRDLLLDLADVPYMSSAGIRAINHLFTMLRANTPAETSDAMQKGLTDGTFRSPHLKLLNPSPRVLEVLKMAGVDMFLEVHNNLKDALASF